LLEAVRQRVLLSAMAVQAHEREEFVRLSICGLQLVKPGSRPNLLQSAALGSAPYRSANVCVAKVPRSFGYILEYLSQV
jgi:hypothetical protein